MVHLVLSLAAVQGRGVVEVTAGERGHWLLRVHAFAVFVVVDEVVTLARQVPVLGQSLAVVHAVVGLLAQYFWVES